MKYILTTTLISLFVSSHTYGQQAPTKPVTLREAVQMAIKTHPSLKAAEEAHKAAEEAIYEATSELYPTIDADIAGGRENSENSSTINSGNQHNTLTRFESSLTIRQNLYTGGRVSNNIFKRRYSAREKSFDRIDEKEKISLNAADAYVRFCQNRALIKLATENVRVHKEILNNVEVRLERGQARQADVIQVKGRLAQAQAQLQREVANKGAINAQFYEAVGHLPSSKLAEPEDLFAAIPKKLQIAKDTARREHPALAARRESIKASESAISERKGSYYPQVFAEVRLQENENLDGVEQTDDSYSALLRINWNLFNGGADLAATSRLNRELNQSQFLLQNETGKVLRNVATAWYDYQGILVELNYFLKYEKAAGNTIRAYREQYKLNQRTLFDLLNAQNELFTASSRVIESNYAKKLATYSLLANMGSFSKPVFANTVAKVPLEEIKAANLLTK